MTAAPPGLPAPVAPLLEAQGLARHYPLRRRLLSRPAMLRAVDGVSFAIEAGRTLAVVGESGSGKSSLGRLVCLIEKPNEGRLVIDGIDTSAPAGPEHRHLRRTVQMVFQNPYGSLNPRWKIGATLEEPLAINLRLGKAERRERVHDMLVRVGLAPEQANRYPHMFSGGQRQRIAIARALMLRPKLVVADEPVAALDLSIQAQILNLLKDLQQEFGLAYLFISHDLDVVRFIADEVLVLHLGRVVEQATKDALFDRPLHPYTQALLASIPRIARRAVARSAPDHLPVKGDSPAPLEPPEGCGFSARCPFVAGRCRSERPVLRLLARSRVACHEAERFL
jgi:dipeptide transport system ATP-binding protein